MSIDITQIQSMFFPLRKHLFICHCTYWFHFILPICHYSCFLFSSYKVNSHAKIFISNEISFRVVLWQRTLMPSLSEHKHFRIIKIRTYSVYYHVFVRLIICQPVEVLQGNTCKVYPDSSVLFNKPYSQQIWFLLYSLSSPSSDDILELLHVRNVLMNIFASYKVDSPTYFFCCGSHFLVTDPRDERCFFEVSFPIHPNNFGKIHHGKSNTWKEN